nr:hypothetical protein [uncultured Rhodopila sp.]
MTVITTRIYDTPQNAKGAVTKLKSSYFSDDQITLVSSEGKTADAVVAAITAFGVPASNAKAYAETIGRGASLVAVRPSFGKAGEAAQILNSFSPTDGDELVVEDAETASPFTSTGPKAKLLDDPHPVSNYFKWPLLSEDRLGLSKKFGWSLLANDSFPASKLFGWKLLSDVATPASKQFGWKLLSDDPTPLSSKYNWKLLIDDPTWLSSKLGWPVLSKS